MSFSFGNYEYRHEFSDELDYLDWDISLLALQDNIKPMLWNLFLAFIPLTLSIVLFNKPRSTLIKLLTFIPLTITTIGCYPQFIPLIKFILQEKISFLFIIIFVLSFASFVINIKGWDLLQKILWYFNTFLFILFLPNASYVLTDIIHLVFDIRKGYPMTTIILFLIPQYTIFIFLAMEAYTISLMNVAVYLDKIDNKNYIFITEISLNLLSALGVYIGRFARLNSWDIFYKPKSVLERLSKIFLEQNTEITIITMFLIFLFFYQWLKYFNLLLIKYYKYYNRQDNLT